MDIATSLDALYLSLALVAIILGVLLAVLLYRAIKLVGNIENITKSVSALLDLANSFMIKPVEILTMILEYVGKAMNSGSRSKKK